MAPGFGRRDGAWRILLDGTIRSHWIDALQKATAKLGSENTGLKSQVAKSEAKRDKLSADVSRLKNLRAKYLAEIAEFRSKD